MLWIIKPETDANGDLRTSDKGSPQFGKSGFVYDNHILFRSRLKLKDETRIEIPGDSSVRNKSTRWRERPTAARTRFKIG